MDAIRFTPEQEQGINRQPSANSTALVRAEHHGCGRPSIGLGACGRKDGDTVIVGGDDVVDERRVSVVCNDVVTQRLARVDVAAVNHMDIGRAVLLVPQRDRVSALPGFNARKSISK